VRGFEGGVGSKNGTAARGEVEGYGAANTFRCAAGSVLDVWLWDLRGGVRDMLGDVS
jgi:hypothetical protein